MIKVNHIINHVSEAQTSSKSKKWKKHVHHKNVKDMLECTLV